MNIWVDVTVFYCYLGTWLSNFLLCEFASIVGLGPSLSTRPTTDRPEKFIGQHLLKWLSLIWRFVFFYFLLLSIGWLYNVYVISYMVSICWFNLALTSHYFPRLHFALAGNFTKRACTRQSLLQMLLYRQRPRLIFSVPNSSMWSMQFEKSQYKRSMCSGFVEISPVGLHERKYCRLCRAAGLYYPHQSLAAATDPCTGSCRALNPHLCAAADVIGSPS